MEPPVRVIFLTTAIILPSLEEDHLLVLQTKYQGFGLWYFRQEDCFLTKKKNPK